MVARLHEIILSMMNNVLNEHLGTIIEEYKKAEILSGALPSRSLRRLKQRFSFSVFLLFHCGADNAARHRPQTESSNAKAAAGSSGAFLSVLQPVPPIR